MLGPKLGGGMWDLLRMKQTKGATQTKDECKNRLYTS